MRCLSLERWSKTNARSTGSISYIRRYFKSSLLLAFRAVKRRPLPEAPGPDGGVASPAGVARAAVNLERKLEIAGSAVAGAEVAQGGSAGPEGVPQRFANRLDQPMALDPGDFPGVARGVDTRREQRFIRINIADAGHEAAVEQGIADVALATV